MHCLARAKNNKIPARARLHTCTEEFTELSERLLCLLVELILVFTVTALALRLQRGEPDRFKSSKEFVGEAQLPHEMLFYRMKAHNSSLPPLESKLPDRLRSWLQPLTQDHNLWEQLDSSVTALSAAQQERMILPWLPYHLCLQLPLTQSLLMVD